MRTDIAPFTSKYVRQAIAYSLDRPAIVTALFKGYAQVGNDNPFAPFYKCSVGPPTVPQRAQDLTKAKALLAQGGVPNGFKTPFFTETTEEMPRYAEIIAQSAKAIGVDIALTVETPTKYYGDTFGSSDWLDGEMSLVDYGSRGVPNLYLEAPLQTIDSKTGQGAWNAARFNNATYDTLSKQFVAAVDLSAQRNLAQQIELLLLVRPPHRYAEERQRRLPDPAGALLLERLPQLRGGLTDAVVVGAANRDWFFSLERLPAPGETVRGRHYEADGGKGANQAAQLALLGVSTAFVGRVGDDASGTVLVDGLREAGVDTRFLGRTNGTKTGTGCIWVTGVEDKRIVVSPGANASLTAEDVDAAASAIEESALVLVQL
jgi:hypothetical protein